MTNDQVQALLAGVLTGSPPAALLADQVSPGSDTDGTAALVAQLLSQSDPAEPDAQSDDEITELRRELRALRGRLADARSELDVLRLRNDQLAASLGACYLCFGSDFECPNCAGQGRPGWIQPDAGLYEQLIAPVSERRLDEAGATRGSQPAISNEEGA